MGAKVGNWRSAMTLVALYHYVNPQRSVGDIRRAICQDFPFARHFAGALSRSVDELAIVDFLRGIQRRTPLPSAELTAFLEGDTAPGVPRYSGPTRREYYRRLNVLAAHVLRIRHDHFARKAEALAAVHAALRARGERPAKGGGNVWVLFDTRCRQQGIDPLALADPKEATQDFDDYLRQTLHLDEGTRKRYRSVVTGYLTRLGRLKRRRVPLDPAYKEQSATLVNRYATDPRNPREPATIEGFRYAVEHFCRFLVGRQQPQSAGAAQDAIPDRSRWPSHRDRARRRASRSRHSHRVLRRARDQVRRVT